VTKILVIFPNYIGDVVMTTPALKRISTLYPSAQIIAVVSEKGYPALKHNQRIFDFAIRPVRFRGVVERIKFVNLLRNKCGGVKCDIAYVFRDTFFNRILSCFSSRKSFFIKITNSSAESYKIAALKTVGVDAEDEKTLLANETEFCLSKQDIIAADEFIEANSIPERFAVIHPATSRPAKNWSQEKFLQIAIYLWQRYKIKTIFTGSSEDVSYIEGIIHNSKTDSQISSENYLINSAGILPLGTTAALISRALIVISCDSGIMHIAYTLGRNTIGLFGSTHPDKYSPYPTNFAYLYKTHCPPCYKSVCPQITGRMNSTPRCMDEIKVEDVIKKIDEFMKKESY